jgi:hypothetical protein
VDELREVPLLEPAEVDPVESVPVARGKPQQLEVELGADESYAARSPGAFDDACERARQTERAGAGIGYVRTTLVPGDETVLHLFDAKSVEALETAACAAGLRFERIVEAIDDLGDQVKETGR